MNNSKKGWISVLILGILVVVAIYTVWHGNELDRELQEEYPLLKYEEKLAGRVVFKYDFVANNFRDFLVISRLQVDACEKTIIAQRFDKEYGSGVNELVEVGDSIFKDYNNDTVIIMKSEGDDVFRLLRRDEL